jgi:ribose transport system ATP-binding protein
MPGEVHALVGHNGSGKSTLVKVLAGQLRPDPDSEVEIGGHPLIWQSPRNSEQLGLRVVHQNLALVTGLSVTENVVMGPGGYATRGLLRIRWRDEHRRVAEEMSRLGYEIDPREPVDKLPQATRSAVAIARALIPRGGGAAPHVLLLDEVSATMPELEIKRLLSVVRTLKSRGVSVLYVSHHLEEVVEIADRVTVLRNGEKVVCKSVGELTQQTLADLLVGGTEWREHLPQKKIDTSSTARTAHRVEVRNLAGGSVNGLSFDAGAGRVIGIAGVTGSGRDEVVPMLFGAVPREGEVRLGATTIPPANPRASVRMGITLVPSDRLTSAIVPTQSVRENLTLSSLSTRKPFTLLKTPSERLRVIEWIRRLDIRGATPDENISTLSGGNQQKVIIARCLAVEPKLLLLDEPTQGVDIGALSEIHRLIREVAASSAVIVSSSDSYELASLCTEVLVMQKGSLVGRLLGKDVTEENIDRLQLT